jgi:hypothetical protein
MMMYDSACDDVCVCVCVFVGLVYQGKDIVFRFIIVAWWIWPLDNNNRSIFIWGILKDDILTWVETWD